MVKAVALMVAVGLLGHLGNLNWQQVSASRLARLIAGACIKTCHSVAAMICRNRRLGCGAGCGFCSCPHWPWQFTRSTAAC